MNSGYEYLILFLSKIGLAKYPGSPFLTFTVFLSASKFIIQELSSTDFLIQYSSPAKV